MAVPSAPQYAILSRKKQHQRVFISDISLPLNPQLLLNKSDVTPKHAVAFLQKHCY
jgi:hypothetical protein